MAGNVEIIVKKVFISAKVAELNSVAKSVAKRKINSKCSNSKGNTIDEIDILIDELNCVGTELGQLMLNNAAVVNEIGIKFAQMDLDIASMYEGKKHED